MARFFNTAGPVNDRDHYCLSPLDRFHLDEILLPIEQKKYFVLHAPRQTGKTSSLLALRTYLNETGQYHCLYSGPGRQGTCGTGYKDDPRRDLGTCAL